MEGFREKLARRQKRTNSLVCVGLDPVFEKKPACASSITDWMCRIVDETAENASMFKPNVAHWESIPCGVGIAGLKTVIYYIHNKFPDIPVFLDCKRGDIARTQEQYRKACFDVIGADGMNFSPYMGRDCMAALVDKENLGRALVGLCYTSNFDARDIQDLLIGGSAHPMKLWEYVAYSTLRWAEELGVTENAGLVMAAAYENPKGSGKIYSEHLTRCRNIVGNSLWFLIPGIGTQGGYIAETVKAAYRGPGSIAINSSSEIVFASSGEDYAQAAGQKTRELRDKINAALEESKKG